MRDIKGAGEEQKNHHKMKHSQKSNSEKRKTNL